MLGYLYLIALIEIYLIELLFRKIVRNIWFSLGDVDQEILWRIWGKIPNSNDWTIVYKLLFRVDLLR